MQWCPIGGESVASESITFPSPDRGHSGWPGEMNDLPSGAMLQFFNLKRLLMNVCPAAAMAEIPGRQQQRIDTPCYEVLQQERMVGQHRPIWGHSLVGAG